MNAVSCITTLTFLVYVVMKTHIQYRKHIVLEQISILAQQKILRSILGINSLLNAVTENVKSVSHFIKTGLPTIDFIK